MDISFLFEGGSLLTQKKKKITFYSVCATLVLAAMLLLTLAGYGIVSAIIQSSQANSGKLNIGLTKTLTIPQSDIYSGDLLLLDATHPLHKTTSVTLMSVERPKTDTGSSIYSVRNTASLSLRADVLKQFNAMMEDFYKQTKDDNLLVYDAYDSSKSSQAAIYESGASLSLGYYTPLNNGEYARNESIYGVEVYNWIYDNCHKYGFTLLESEAEIDDDGEYIGSNVFRYVGIPHATAMAERKLSFEDYLSYLKENTSAAKPLGIMTYAIYYLGAQDSHVVPEKYEYSVSGNNADGFIITVDLSKS